MNMIRLRPLPSGSVTLLPGLIQQRADLNRRYVLSLKSEHLLQNHFLEAGLCGPLGRLPDWPEGGHGGWESPTCQLRGHFLGHWLSAAAHLIAARGDQELKSRADGIVAGLGRCQQANGGEWAGSIPEKYFDWLARGQEVWAPHYTAHKTLLGLYEMAALTGSSQALDILTRWAGWFTRWTRRLTREQMDAVLEVETGGMMELWADLYELTGRPETLELMACYERRRFFDALLTGQDVLTNRHANTRIPEDHGAARAWEVTGEPRWRRVVEAFWRSAVTERPAFCTGGQTDGEIWTPSGEMAARLSLKNQEHCTVYNMMRLAEYLFRWTGEAPYADYWERNLYNGILAQQHPDTGMVAYFLPLKAGSVKRWSTPTETFSCCLGTMVQAHTRYESSIYYENDDGLVISQFIPSRLVWRRDGMEVRVELRLDKLLTSLDEPRRLGFTLELDCQRPAAFALQIRLPDWRSGPPSIALDGSPHEPVLEGSDAPVDWICLRRTWEGRQSVQVEIPRRLTASPLPDAPEMVAFLDGPLVLAGLFDRETVLEGDPEEPESILSLVHELEWYRGRQGYRTRVTPHGVRFLPLFEIRDEPYAVYFPVISG